MHEQYDRNPDALSGKLPAVAEHLDTARADVLAFSSFPKGIWLQIWRNNRRERNAQPGTVFVLVRQVPETATPTFDDWLAQLSDVHLAEPSRILRIARAAGVLPEPVLVVGCQPGTCEDFAETLSAPVAAAVPVAARRVRELLAELITQGSSAGARRPARHTASKKEQPTWTKVT